MGKGPAGTAAILAFLTLVLAAACLFSLKTGQIAVSWKEIGKTVFTGAGEGNAAGMILSGIRLPRILLGCLVGASLSSAGVVFQGLLRNPLADPFLLGLSGGGALGAVLVIVTGAAYASPLLLPAAAFCGALTAIIIVIRITAAGPVSPTTLILAGVVVSAFCSALVMFLNSVSPSARVHGALFWMMGSLASPPAGVLPATAVAAAAGLLVLFLSARQLNALSMGEEVAAHLGVDVGPVRMRMIVAASLVTGAAVAASGLIGFIGLVVPHALRNLVGADHRLLLPASALGGAAVLVLADAGARSLLAPVEMPVGVITALFGAPFFLVLLRRRRGWMG